MYLMRKLFSLALTVSLFILSVTINLYAQSSKEIGNLETEAKYYFDKRIYHQALPLYIKLDSLKPEYPNYIYPLGICYINTSYNEEEALKYLEVCKKTPNKYPQTLHYYLGKAYHLSNKFDAAIEEYEKYLSYLYNAKNKNAVIIKDIYRQIQMCENGKQLIKTPIQVDITNLGPYINSKYPDYGPVLSADEREMIFTSSRPETTGGLTDPFDGGYHEDIYIASKKDSIWAPATNIGPHINTGGHDASISLTPDGQQLLIYRFNSTIFSPEEDGLLLSQLNGTEWSEPKRLIGEINSKAWEPSACLINNGSYIIFSSNREGGFGGLDLYIAKKLANGEWARPINLGSSINTQYDEDSPFLHPDGQTLYFSSNGHNSMGGFDMFYSKPVSPDTLTKWLKPINLGYPLNTGHDEIHFTLSSDGKRIYFSSIRKEGYGDKDIYFATVENSEVKDVLVIVGIIQDSISKAPVNAQIEVINTENNEVIGVYNSNKTTGKYIMVLPEGGRYKIVINSDNYKVCDDFITTKELSGYQEVESNINLCPEPLIKIK